MSLRPDSVYRVDLRGSSPPQRPSDQDPTSPPKILQLRLTEQALQQLNNALGSSSRIRIDVNPTDPLLMIGDNRFPLHAPLPSTAGSSSRSIDAAASSSTAPHELFRLSPDESTLQSVGVVATKFTVKPTRDVSAVAQRLKAQKEEEEHRKEERRKALMAGASPQLSTSSSSRTGINKNLASVRSASGLSSLIGSSLSRSSSLSRLPARREPNLLSSASLSTGVSREASPAASPTAGQIKLQGTSYDAGRARRTERAIADSPRVSSTSRTYVADSERSLSRPRVQSGMDEEGEVSDAESPRQAALLSSPADAAKDASKKASKLTTRQRLAKATKAGSRLLKVSERNATPERRVAPTSATASPAPKAGASVSLSRSESTRSTASSSEHAASSLRKALDSHDAHMGRDDAIALTNTSAGKARFSAPAKESAGTDKLDSHRSREAQSNGSSANLKERATSKLESPATVQVVTMRKTRPSPPSASTKTREAGDSSSSSRPSALRPDRPAGDDRSRQPDTSVQRDVKPSSSSPKKEVNTRQAGDADVETGRRKRRRTEDVMLSATAQHRQDDRSSASHGIARSREASRESSLRHPEAGIPPSASLPTLTSSAQSRLPSISEAPHRESRQRDVSTDSTTTTSPSRPTRGVGHGATHWSEPWLDVRSSSDWHRLASRFTKTQAEYTTFRAQLQAENARLDKELALATAEEGSLLLAPNKIELETERNTRSNARREESPEEGEMDEDGEVDGEKEKEEEVSFVWRESGSKQPMGYNELVGRLKELGEMQGALSRMHRVLVDYKARQSVAAGAP